jgi:predicted nucleotidyltransferase
VASDLDLRPALRQAWVDQLEKVLSVSVAGSRTSMLGSLALGTADDYSDIDLMWVVPDDRFETASSSLVSALARIGSVTSLRLDPDFARSDRRRLIFVRLANLPLFWRVDIDLRAASIADDDAYDRENAAAVNYEEWSRPASAIENAVAAIKAIARGQFSAAEELLRRGYERIGRALDPKAAPSLAIAGLALACAELEPALKGLADRAIQVVATLIAS